MKTEDLSKMTLANAREICEQADAVRVAFGWDLQALAERGQR